MSPLNPSEIPFAWDTLRVMGSKFPGLARVSGGRQYKLDKKGSGGADGATLTGFGHEPADVKISVRIWTPEHFEALPAALALLMPRPTKGRPGAVDVYHPALQLLSIKSLYFTKVGVPEETGTRRVYEVRLEGTEYLPVKGGGVSTVNHSQHRVTEVATTAGSLTAAGLPGDGTFGRGLGVLAPDQDPKDLGP